ncbi:MAG TPA: PP2C family serine/threonine-protein phosphatase [Allosphingosinicella sp.]|nr:PP2C family serine/threonine-protein phosphatase [Allosphingosinicella sp.]
MTFPPFRIESAALTHRGLVREQNEDGFCLRERAGLWAVADGMGGHEGGEWASARLVAELDRVELEAELEAAERRLADAIRAANDAIAAEAEARGGRMGTTLVALLVRERAFLVLWVGDSRAYLLRDGALRRLSRDHSRVQEMVELGLIAPAEAAGHPLGHILTRALGERGGAEIDRAGGEVKAGDVFLLCSDGLHGCVGEGEIRRQLAQGSPRRALDGLIAAALAAGGPDNVTGIVVRAG